MQRSSLQFRSWRYITMMLASLLVLALTVAACDSESGGAAESSDEFPDSGKVTVLLEGLGMT